MPTTKLMRQVPKQKQLKLRLWGSQLQKDARDLNVAATVPITNLRNLNTGTDLTFDLLQIFQSLTNPL